MKLRTGCKHLLFFLAGIILSAACYWGYENYSIRGARVDIKTFAVTKLLSLRIALYSKFITVPLERFDIYEFDVGKSHTGFESKEWKSNIRTFRELYEAVNARFDQYETLYDDAGFSDWNAKRAFYFMNVVSGLWAYGNLKNLQLPGCVMDNEIRGPIEPSEVSVKTYLTSPIGCCTDYTAILNVLLTYDGIKNRVVSIPGYHVFNEAFIKGKWWVLDANTNLAFSESWRDIVDGNSKVAVYLFPHPNMNLHSRTYRPAIGRFRASMLLSAANEIFTEFSYSDDWLETLPYGRAFSHELSAIGR